MKIHLLHPLHPQHHHPLQLQLLLHSHGPQQRRMQVVPHLFDLRPHIVQLPAELGQRIDVELTILTLNALLREYFTNPANFGRLLGERRKEVLENRVKRYVQQSVARLFDLM